MKNYFLNLFAYEQWANNIITYNLLKIEQLPPKALLLMSHIIDAQIVWLSRIKSITVNVRVWEEYSIEEISGKLNNSSSELADYVNSISDSDLEKTISYNNTKGENFESSLKDILTHMIVHSSYHRGQIILLIKPLVQEVPYTDYIHYARNVRANTV